MTFWLAALNVILAAYNVGSMWTLQLMHYPLYASIGPGEFRDYIRSNNRRAGLPAIVPGVSFALLSIVLAVFATGQAVRLAAIAEALANVGVMASTARWQGRLHGELGREGYSKERIAKLVTTNWIRSVLYAVALLLAVAILAFGRTLS